jgi:hypothetical protein
VEYDDEDSDDIGAVGDVFDDAMLMVMLMVVMIMVKATILMRK